jgi:hypothetical protein
MAMVAGPVRPSRPSGMAAAKSSPALAITTV